MRQFIIIVFCIIFLPCTLRAENEQEELEFVYDGLMSNDQFRNKKERFMPYGMNSASWQWTEEDDQALEANFSFLFKLFDCRIGNDSNNSDIFICHKDAALKPLFFFSYTGQFDFYVSTRDSGPVINRISNPALHLWLISDDTIPFLDYVDLSVEHRSNGQVVEIDERDSQGRLKTQVAFEEGNHAYFDGVSRGANYFAIGFGRKHEISQSSNFNWQINTKIYINDDSEVNWGEFENESVSVRDYDISKVTLSYRGFKINHEMTVIGQYTIGREMFDTDSFDAAVIVPVGSFYDNWKFPLMLKVHHGPMETLSNYTKSVTSASIGLAFWW